MHMDQVKRLIKFAQDFHLILVSVPRLLTEPM